MLKKTLTFFIIYCILGYLAVSQTTYYGLGAGQIGSTSSHYGQEAGNQSTTWSSRNSFFGAFSGRNIKGGDNNVAIGYYSLYRTTTGNNNVAIGYYSLISNTGQFNTATGALSSYNNTTGRYNVANGYKALYSNSTGYRNVAIGYLSGNNSKGASNTFVGGSTGYAVSGSTYSNSMALGYNTKVSASNQVRIGSSSVTSIGGQVSWSTLSDGRFKKNIKEDVSGLEFITQLHPVSYTLDQRAIQKFLNVEMNEDELAVTKAKSPEHSNLRHIGFIAQEVDRLIDETGYVFSGVVAPLNDQDYYTIRYSEFVVPLVKAVQELNEKVQSQQNLINLLLGENRKEKEISEKDIKMGKEIELLQNSPNPFSEETKIIMSLPNSVSHAEIKVYDLKGTEVKSFMVKERGTAALTINGYELNPGMYIYALIVDNQFITSKKLIITK